MGALAGSAVGLFVLAWALALAVCSGAAVAQNAGLSDNAVRIGVLTDMSGALSDLSGAGSATAVKMCNWRSVRRTSGMVVTCFNARLYRSYLFDR